MVTLGDGASVLLLGALVVVSGVGATVRGEGAAVILDGASVTLGDGAIVSIEIVGSTVSCNGAIVGTVAGAIVGGTVT